MSDINYKCDRGKVVERLAGGEACAIVRCPQLPTLLVYPDGRRRPVEIVDGAGVRFLDEAARFRPPHRPR